MSEDFYKRQFQKLYFVPESSFGTPYAPDSDSTAWTALAADYPHWRRLDTIPDAVDINVPYITKEKMYDIDDAKHASKIAEGNFEPQEFTISTNLEVGELLSYAIGSAAVSHTRAMTQTIECVAKSSITNGDYFLLDTIDGDGDMKHYLIWFDVDGGGSAPTVTDIPDANRVEVSLSGAADTAAGTAGALETALEALPEITSANVTSGTCTVIHANSGAVQPARDGAAATDFTFTVSTYGVSTYTITEGLGYDLKSFTLHAESANEDGASQDIAFDFFSCVISSADITVSFDDKIAKAEYTVMCPYAVAGNICTNPPPKKKISAFPTMKALQESANNCLIQEGTTSTVNGTDDLTPKSVNSITFTIENNVEFQADVESQYKKYPIAGKRDITLSVSGFIDNKTILTYQREAYSNSSGEFIPSSASERINSVIKLQKNATYDYLSISIYNWLVEEHNLHFQTIDEAIKAADITLTDGVGNSAGRIINSMTMVNASDQVAMGV